MIPALIEGLTYDDVTLKPAYSTINSRREVDISVDMGNDLILQAPIISAPMDTVTESAMCIAMHQQGGMGILHRFCTIEEQVKQVDVCVAAGLQTIAAAVGIGEDTMERVAALLSAGVNVLCVDVAHAHHIRVRNAIKSIRDRYGDKSVYIIAGNVASGEGFTFLAESGADAVKVSIGSGSICSTRLNTGYGVPNITAIMECFRASLGIKRDIAIIADGGIRTGGDVVKALAAGADAVMCGSMFSATDEAPGKVVFGNSGRPCKQYRGLASIEAQKSWCDRHRAPEGISALVPIKGSVTPILEDLKGHIQSGLSYQGSRNMKEFRNAPKTFYKQTSAGVREGDTHILNRI
jgi:IMP dehydrogenase